MAKTETELLCAYLVVGDDLLKRERVLKRLRMRLEKLGDLSFNSDKFDGAEAKIDEILSACSTMPFASEKRLVVVENASKIKKAEAKEIAEYINNPVETTVLILIADTLPKDSPLTEAAKKLGGNAWIDCAPPSKKDFPAQVCDMAKTHGLNLSFDAAQSLISLIGENTVHIDEELKKIAISRQDQESGAAVSKEDIEDFVAHITEFKPWDFVDAFSRRDVSACVKMRAHMSSTSVHALLPQCVSRIREMICVHSVAPGGGDAAGRVASALGLPSNRAFVAKYRIEQARNFKLKELTDALISSVETERMMKSGIDPELAFDEWVYSTIGKI